MDPAKRSIIVKEIEHWRRSRLLPEQYCDFLLNLYREDAAAARADRSAVRPLIYTFTVLTFVAMLALNFIAFPLPLQIAIAAAATCACYAAGWMLRERKPVLSVAAFGLGALLTLIAGPLLLRLEGADTPARIAGYIAACCILWIVLGLTVRLSTFHFCGWAGLALVYAWYLYRYAEAWPMWTVHAAWVPFALLFVLLAWMIRRSAGGESLVLLGLGLMLWLMPDAMQLLMNGAGAAVQTVLIAKLLAAFALFVLLRRAWMPGASGTETRTNSEASGR
jgi:hypothetical protein